MTVKSKKLNYTSPLNYRVAVGWWRGDKRRWEEFRLRGGDGRGEEGGATSGINPSAKGREGLEGGLKDGWLGEKRKRRIEKPGWVENKSRDGKCACTRTHKTHTQADQGGKGMQRIRLLKSEEGGWWGYKPVKLFETKTVSHK